MNTNVETPAGDRAEPLQNPAHQFVSAGIETPGPTAQRVPAGAEPKEPTPDHILQTGLSFWASKTLLSAIELGLFAELAEGPLSTEELCRRLNLHSRSARDFLDALVSLHFLRRDGDTYANTPETDLYLDPKKPSYAGGILEMANARLYQFWGSLTEALQTGKPQNEARSGGSLFESLYSSPEKLERFLKGMTGLSLATGKALAQKFPWLGYVSFADIGGAEGAVAAQIALAHPHLLGVNFDLPIVRPISEKYLKAKGVANRVAFREGDFFQDSWPRAEVLIMGHILHDWNLEQKQLLLEKAYDALPKGGALVVHESLIDDDRSQNTFGLLMSLNMLIETPGGFDYTGADCQSWMRDAGFRYTRVEHLIGPDSMVIGIK